MNTKLIETIAKAVLYEGYMLYPYRPSSVKNRQRFNFGVLYPQAYSEVQAGSDAWGMQTECLVQGIAPVVEVKVRFLKLVARTMRSAGSEPQRQLPDAAIAPGLGINSAVAPWQEAIECEVTVPVRNLAGMNGACLDWPFVFPAKEETEALIDKDGRATGLVDRKQDSVRGTVEMSAVVSGDGLFKLQVRVKNLTLLDDASQATRDAALMRSLVSAHTLLGVEEGQFVSLLDPPEDLKEIAASCQNLGTWPVLVGAGGERDTMLSSPIILYDYPQIAPESPGDLFDGTEIDEILALRILTMTEEEKREMRSTDERARRILDRTESLPAEHLAKLHGTLRELHALEEEAP